MQISHSATKVGFNWICALLCIRYLAGFKLSIHSGWILNSASGQAGYPTTGYLYLKDQYQAFVIYLADIWYPAKHQARIFCGLISGQSYTRPIPI